MKQGTVKRVEDIIQELKREEDIHPIAFWQKRAEKRGCSHMFAEYMHFLTSFYGQEINAGEKSVRLKPAIRQKEWCVACYPEESSQNNLRLGLRTEDVSTWGWPERTPVDRKDDITKFDVTPVELTEFLESLRNHLYHL